jgi:hypothetical protein
LLAAGSALHLLGMKAAEDIDVTIYEARNQRIFGL